MEELLEELIRTLDLLVAQSQAYERALPHQNYQARAAVAALGELARQALNEARGMEEMLEEEATPSHAFSPRELEVLSLAARGLTNKEIGYRLHLSERTVQFHLRSIFNKTGTDSRTQVVALAVQNGWIQLE
jgi:DNA-binding NarL/FixJ family response regulator